MFRRLRDFRIIPFVYVTNSDEAVGTAEALSKGGLPVMEMMYRKHSDHEIIKHIRKELPDFWIGAAGVLNRDLLLRVFDVKTCFATSPGVNAETIQEAVKHEYSFAPGICTPSDIEVALVNGCSNFQFFPAEQSGGPEMLKAIISPFEHLNLEFVPRGGVSKDNLKTYLDIPQVAAVSVDWIASREDIANCNWQKITENAIEAGKLIKG